MKYSINVYEAEDTYEMGLNEQWPGMVVCYASVGHPGSCTWLVPNTDIPDYMPLPDFIEE